MDLSGLIFVALALVWAVVLLPKALRQHDEVAQTRSVDRVSDSMRVLARREVVSEREARLVVTPPAPPKKQPAPPTEPVVDTVVAPDAAVVAPAPLSKERVAARIDAQRKAAAGAARRRRRILLVLVLAGAGVGVAAALGHLQPWAPAVPVAVTLAFLVLARVLVRKEHARWDAELGRLRSRVSAPTPAPTPIAEETAAPAPVEETAAPATVDDTSSLPLGLLDDVTPTTDAGSLWDPLPVTLPTYVSKPRASRSVRTIDLQAPGVSSSGHDAASSALVADAATSSPPDDLPQRAVGS